ncbi:MAG: HpsJ family protein [Prochlorotrichaceae cyanobacterium]
MKTASQRQFLLLAPRTLIVVGLILIVSALLDYAILLFPPNFLDRQWQIGFVSQMVDRGIIPLVGLALFFTGLWSLNQVSDRPGSNFFGTSLGIPALVLSSFLGLIFLVAAPLHINNSFQQQSENLSRIATEADQANTQLEQSIQAQVEQEKARIQSLLANQTELQQAIQSGQVSQTQAVLLQQFQTDPASLDTYLTEESQKVRQQALEELNKQKFSAEKQAKEAGFKTSIRTGLNSLFLAVGYAIVGWTGLKEAKSR